MTKPGRNAPCPCGSGKKYKKCCLPLQETAAKETKRLSAEPVTADQFWAEADELDEISNRVVDLVKEGSLDEAEELCGELRRRFPDQIDGIERMAYVHEARGNNAKAAELYRQAAVFAKNSKGFDAEGIAWFNQQADRLDPPK
jgi:tetratricopeptide (TPR) repeat protein